MVEDSSKGAKVSTTLAPGMKALLDQCITRNLYGDQAATVRQFIHAGLERLLDQHRLIDAPIIGSRSSTDKTPSEES
jgi:hypothetical protein